MLGLASGPAVAQGPARPAQPLAATPVDTWAVPGTTGPGASGVVTSAWQKSDKNQDKKSPLQLTPKEIQDREQFVKLPSNEIIFSFPGDAVLERFILDRLRQDAEKVDEKSAAAKYPESLTFPKNPAVGGGIAYRPKTLDYPPMRVDHEPLYVVHRRLHFEEKNAERYGWDLGIIQPFVSAAYFYKDVLLWPNSIASGFATGFFDTNVGKCLPGSPTPYMLYPPGLTITGSVVEGLVVTGVAFAIP